jgi:ActD protein
MSAAFLVGSFPGPAQLLAAVRAARAGGHLVHDVYAPYALHGLDEALGRRRSRLAWVTLAGGMAGLVSAVALQVWGAVLDWPLNVGGKPANSALAFLPITFEATILLGGLATAGAFFWRSRLRPRAAPVPLAPGVTDDVLALALVLPGGAEARDEEEAMRALLLAAGAGEVRREGP